MKILNKNTHHHLNLSILFVFITFIVVSCKKTEIKQEIPSYIIIKDVEVETNNNQGANTNNITDVWVYLNEGQSRGAYPINSIIPILTKDSTTIIIRAGIKDNGISNIRIPYTFYKSYNETVYLHQDSIIEISPIFEYQEYANISHENFEGVGTNIDTTIKSDIDFIINTENNNNYAEANLTDENLIFEVSTEDFIGLPQVGSPVYLELDYKSNTTFTIGAYINYIFGVENRPLVNVTKKDEWNKIYINLTNTVSSATNNISMKFYINMYRTDTNENKWIKFDNLKLVY